MELNITAPAEKLLLRLWESLEKSTIGLFKPWQLKRIAKAEAVSERFKMLTSEKTEQDKRKLISGKVYYDTESDKLLPIEEDTEISKEKMLISNEYVNILCKSQNVANAIIIAMEQLKTEQEPTTTEEPISQDWLNQWGEHAGFVSDKEMQLLWGKVLAGEVKKPGSFSLRTMQFLRSIAKKEAELIQMYFQYCIDDFLANNIINHTNDDSMDLSDRILLSELGIISLDLSNALVTTFTIPPQNDGTFRKLFHYYNWLIIIQAPNSNISFDLPIIQLTTLGQEIKQLANCLGNEAYIELVCKKILSLNKELKIFKTTSFTFVNKRAINIQKLQEVTK